MSARTTTPDRILEVSRRLFNERGYAATSLSEIAAEVGISQGNLNYHFPAKADLALKIAATAREQMQVRRSTKRPGNIADDYVDHLVFAMGITWSHRFLLRDRMHFADKVSSPDAEFLADFEELYSLMKRIEAEGLFRRGAVSDLRVLTRAIWVMSRYWMDYLREIEGRNEITWRDQERGIEHHFALLLPCLTAKAKSKFRAALALAERYGWRWSTTLIGA